MMTLEEVIKEEWFWAAAAAMFTLAGLVGGGVSWGVATYLKRRERPEPDWVHSMHADGYKNSRTGVPDGIQVNGRIVNAGDGTAFNFHMIGRNCTTGIPHNKSDVNNRMGVMRTGDSVDFWVSIDLDKWDAATLQLVWTNPPTRLKRTETVEIRLIEHCNHPTIMGFNEETGQYDEVPI